MYMRDKLGSFEIIVDKERRVVHEKLSGLFTNNDSNRLEKEYLNNIIPYLGEGKWVKLCDMREYIPNTSVGYEDISYFLKRIVPFGFIGCAVIISNTMIKNHLSLSVKGIESITFEYFEGEEEADKYLRKLGF